MRFNEFNSITFAFSHNNNCKRPRPCICFLTIYGRLCPLHTTEKWTWIYARAQPLKHWQRKQLYISRYNQHDFKICANTERERRWLISCIQIGINVINANLWHFRALFKTNQKPKLNIQLFLLFSYTGPNTTPYKCYSIIHRTIFNAHILFSLFFAGSLLH